MTEENIANLIRLAADGEITDSQRSRLEEYASGHPEVAEAVRFEQELRKAVGRVMSSAETSVPAGLEARVRRALEAAEVGEQDRWSFVRSLGRRRVPTSVAAGLVLLIGVVAVMSIFGWLNQPGSIGPGTGSQVEAGLEFPVVEHLKCTVNHAYAQKKLTLRGVEQVKSYFVDELEWSVEVPDLSSVGFTFVDAGPCTLNGRSVESVHLRYRRGEEIVSVWIERAPRSALTHVADFEDGHAYDVIPTSASGKADPERSYYAWRVGEFVYRLVPSSVRDARAVAQALGMPDVELEEFH